MIERKWLVADPVYFFSWIGAFVIGLFADFVFSSLLTSVVGKVDLSLLLVSTSGLIVIIDVSTVTEEKFGWWHHIS